MAGVPFRLVVVHTVLPRDSRAALATFRRRVGSKPQRFCETSLTQTPLTYFGSVIAGAVVGMGVTGRPASGGGWVSVGRTEAGTITGDGASAVAGAGIGTACPEAGSCGGGARWRLT